MELTSGVPIFLSVTLAGLFANAAAPITLELASELTYPAGEETSATLLVPPAPWAAQLKTTVCWHH